MPAYRSAIRGGFVWALVCPHHVCVLRLFLACCLSVLCCNMRVSPLTTFLLA